MGRRFIEWLVLWGLWILFVSQWNISETVVGCVAAFIAMIAKCVTQRDPLGSFSFQFRWIVQAFWIPYYVFSGTWEALKALSAQLFTRKGCGSFLLSVPFDLGSDDAASQARRAVAIIFTTSTPNFVILDIESQSKKKTGGLLIYHQLFKTPVLKITRKLGAGS